MQPFAMYFPASFDEACELVAGQAGDPIAGGCAMVTLAKEGIQALGDVVNLRSLAAEHSYVEAGDGELRIGALATLRSIETTPAVVEHAPVIADCLGQLASIRIRNSATIGGHLAHADPELDLPPVLAGLETEVVLHSLDGERVLPLTEFMTGFLSTDLREGELIREVRVPIKPERSGVYVKHRSLSEADWPCVGVAAFLADGAGVPAVFLNAVGETPVMQVEGLDEAFADGITEAAIDRAGELASEQCDPIGDARGSEWYKREMAGEFTIRALRQVCGVTPAIPGGA